MIAKESNSIPNEYVCLVLLNLSYSSNKTLSYPSAIYMFHQHSIPTCALGRFGRLRSVHRQCCSLRVTIDIILLSLLPMRIVIVSDPTQCTARLQVESIPPRARASVYPRPTLYSDDCRCARGDTCHRYSNSRHRHQSSDPAYLPME